MPLNPPSTRPRYLTLAYLLLVIYASLHPFSGWRDLGLSPFAFLDGAWPRYWTVFDLTTNVLVYLPLSYLLALTLSGLPGRLSGALAATLLATLVSLSLECLQTWLPSRVPSNLDLACNTLGAVLGAALAVWQGQRFFNHLGAMQARLLAPVPHAELALVMVGLWLLTLLSPEILLFGTGDLRYLIGITPAVPYDAPSFFMIETSIIICNTIAIGLIVRSLLNDNENGNAQALPVLGIFFLLALIVRTLGAAVLVTPGDAFAWLTPGAWLGLLIGCATLLLTLLLPAAPRLAIAALALMAGTVLVNLAPDNPYSAAALSTWRQGHFLSFNGLTRLVASLWPFVLLPYLSLLGRRL